MFCLQAALLTHISPAVRTHLAICTKTPMQEALPPPPPTAPLEAPWRAPPPGFDLRTLRRQASTLRGEAAAACRDEQQVRLSSLQLAEILSATVRNGRDNAAAARERLCCLHATLRRLRAERRSHGEAVRAAVSWQDSLEGLRYFDVGGGHGVVWTLQGGKE